jgi:hypothetical protein
MSIIACILYTLCLICANVEAEVALKAGCCAVTERALGHGRAVISCAYSPGGCQIVTSIADSAGSSWGGIPEAVVDSCCLSTKTEKKSNEK